jgi:hypothetical protein
MQAKYRYLIFTSLSDASNGKFRNRRESLLVLPILSNKKFELLEEVPLRFELRGFARGGGEVCWRLFLGGVGVGCADRFGGGIGVGGDGGGCHCGDWGGD